MLYSEVQSKLYACQVILAFEYLQALDIMHRDLKPENLLIDPTGNIKVSSDRLFVQARGVARGCGGRGPHQAALARGGKRAKIVFKNSREKSDCNFMRLRAIKTKHYSCSAYLSSVSSAITLGLWLRPVRLCWYYANFIL